MRNSSPPRRLVFSKLDDVPMNAITFDRSKARFPIPAVSTSFINGAGVGASGGHRIPVVCPATEEVISELREADAAEVQAAVAAAREAFDKGPWPRMSVDQRKKIMLQIRDVLIANADELAYLESMNAGLAMNYVRGFHVPRM